MIGLSLNLFLVLLFEASRTNSKLATQSTEKAARINLMLCRNAG